MYEWGPSQRPGLKRRYRNWLSVYNMKERKKKAERRRKKEEARKRLKENDKESRKHKRWWGQDSCSSPGTEVDIEKSIDTVDKVGKKEASIGSHTTLVKKSLWHRITNIATYPINGFHPFQRRALGEQPSSALERSASLSSSTAITLAFDEKSTIRAPSPAHSQPSKSEDGICRLPVGKEPGFFGDETCLDSDHFPCRGCYKTIGTPASPCTFSSPCLVRGRPGADCSPTLPLSPHADPTFRGCWICFLSFTDRKDLMETHTKQGSYHLPIIKPHVSDDPSNHKPRAHFDLKYWRGNHEKFNKCPTVHALCRGEQVEHLSEEEMDALGLKYCRCTSGFFGLKGKRA